MYFFTNLPLAYSPAPQFAAATPHRSSLSNTHQQTTSNRIRCAGVALLHSCLLYPSSHYTPQLGSSCCHCLAHHTHPGWAFDQEWWSRHHGYAHCCTATPLCALRHWGLVLSGWRWQIRPLWCTRFHVGSLLWWGQTSWAIHNLRHWYQAVDHHWMRQTTLPSWRVQLVNLGLPFYLL